MGKTGNYEKGNTMTLLKHAFTFAMCALTTVSAVAHDDMQYKEKVVKAFSVNENTQLQIENTNGKVEIEAWDKDEVVIVATIFADNKEGRERIELDFSQSGDTIDIDTHFKKQWGWNNYNHAKVDYFINVPKYIELDKVDLNNGSLSIKGVTGEVNATLNNGKMVAIGLAGNTSVDSNNGSVQLSYIDVLTDLTSIDVESQNGSITLNLPESIDAKIRAKSNNGSISNSFGLDVDKSRSNRKTLSGEIGSGKASVSLSSNNGSIRIKSL